MIDEPQPPGDVEVHVRWLDLDAASPHPDALARTLSPPEMERANRFHTALLRDRYIAARGWLRRLVGERIGAPPESVTIEYGPHGKPRLAAHHLTLEFSVSHCGPAAVIALSTVPLGVDVERAREVPDVEAVAARVFSADEMRALAAAADKSAAFLRGWTRKEAVLKARGTGFSTDARALTVSLDGPPALRIDEGIGGADAAWTLLDISRPGHVAALAVQAPGVSLDVLNG